MNENNVRMNKRIKGQIKNCNKAKFGNKNIFISLTNCEKKVKSQKI